MGNKKFLEDKIINYAKELGFDLVKILPAQSLDENLQKSFYDWIYFEYAGDMEYMKKEPEKRADLLKKFPDAKSIIVLGMNYFMEEKASPTCPNDLFGQKDLFWREKLKIIGFALESENLIENARKKLLFKNLDMIIANQPENIGAQEGEFWFIDKTTEIFKKGRKEDIAIEILKKISQQSIDFLENKG